MHGIRAIWLPVLRQHELLHRLVPFAHTLGLLQHYTIGVVVRLALLGEQDPRAVALRVDLCESIRDVSLHQPVG